MPASSALWWLRRDLRLTDNQALAAALAEARQVVPIFILDPALLHSPYAGPNRLAFLLAGLRDLDARLRRRDSRLIVRQGRPDQVLPQLAAETGATAVFAEADYSPYARHRDRLVANVVPIQFTAGLTVYPPDSVLRADGRPYTVYTPFSRSWKERPLPAKTDLIPTPSSLGGPAAVASLPLPAQPALAESIPFAPGEAEAQRRLDAFVDGPSPPIYRYGQDRNRMDLDGTSGLSPYLRFGMLSIRQVAAAAGAAMAPAPDQEARRGVETWLNELIWREFYIAILHHFPAVRGQSFKTQLRNIPWRNDRQEFAAWCQGQTGYPVVDAAMRQLLSTGWMHNRARMIVASFLVKDLLIDWRWGERWFMQHLVDGDPAANNGGWQWTAGTGTDAAPYFRIFNPSLQGLKFDPSGSYVRCWVPELAQVADRYLHSPWEMPEPVQSAAGCRIGRDYPAPIVDHRQARERTLTAFGAAGELV
jgi:deoxyribodipyrimidine photo-lyase